MAMLAEVKRKQRWILNPRETNWSNDTTKYGQRMLEKMGWTPGKGLGISEQGMTKHIRVAVKADTMGIGFKDSEDKTWLEQQEKFDTILQKLQNSEIDVVKSAKNKSSTKSKDSIESKYKQNRPRNSCKKFSNAKNIKNYSTKDLANIFGRKDFSYKNIDSEEKEITYSKIPDTIDDKNTKADITNDISITNSSTRKNSSFDNDYENNTNTLLDLKNKRSEYCKTEFSSENYQSKNTENDIDSKHSELHSSNLQNSVASVNQFKPIKNKKRGLDSENESNLDYPQQPKHFKKSKLDKSTLEGKDGKSNEAFENNVSDLKFPSENHNNNKFEIVRTELGITNNALDLTDESNDKRRVTFNNYVEYERDSKKKRKLINTFEVENKILKKQKRNNTVDTSYMTGIVNEASEFEAESHSNITRNHETHEINEIKNKKQKKKKSNKTLTLETIEEVQEDDKDVRTEVPIDIDNVETINTNVKLCNKALKKKIKKEQECNQIIDSCDSIKSEIDIDKQVNTMREQVQMEESKVKSIKKNKKEKYNDKDANIANEETLKKITLNKINFIEHLDGSVSEIAKKYKQYKRSLKKIKGKLQKENKIGHKDDTSESVNSYDNKIDVEKESMNVPDIKENNSEKKMEHTRKKLYLPFYDKHFSNFVGSNVHKLKGYGVKA